MMMKLVAALVLGVSSAASLRGLVKSATEPSGSYTGSKTVLGETFTGTVTIESSTSADLVMTGAVSIDCENEAYHLDGSDIVLDNIDVDGDCVHDNLDNYGVTLESATYDADNDEITLSVKYSVLSIDIVLTHDTTMRELALRMIARKALGATPSGSYEVSKTVLGISVTADMAINDDSTVDMSISGPITLSCTSEAYTFADDTITIDNADQDGDCVHDALADNDVTLDSITYDEGADSIAVEVKYGALKITIDLDHIDSTSKPCDREAKALTLAQVAKAVAAMEVAH